jgi:hypothetical protein
LLSDRECCDIGASCFIGEKETEKSTNIVSAVTMLPYFQYRWLVFALVFLCFVWCCRVFVVKVKGIK